MVFLGVLLKTHVNSSGITGIPLKTHVNNSNFIGIAFKTHGNSSCIIGIFLKTHVNSNTQRTKRINETGIGYRFISICTGFNRFSLQPAGIYTFFLGMLLITHVNSSGITGIPFKTHVNNSNFIGIALKTHGKSRYIIGIFLKTHVNSNTQRTQIPKHIKTHVYSNELAAPKTIKKPTYITAN